MVEMLTVMVIIVIIAGLATTSLLVAGQQRALAHDVRQVRNTLVKARTLARSTQRCVKVTVGSHSMTVTPYERCGLPLADPDAAGTTTLEVAPTVSLNAFSNGASALVFDAAGGMDGDGPLDLRVVTSSGELTYRIFPAIGAVRLQP